MAAPRPEVAISVATAADGDEIASVYLASRADALAHLRRTRDDAQDRAWIKETVLSRGTTWVAREGAQIVGFLTLVGSDVDQLYLRPGHYRRGIGSRLLDHARSASPNHMHLYTFQCNARARAFYEAHGFRAARFGDGTLNEECEPDIYYEWHVPAGLGQPQGD